MSKVKVYLGGSVTSPWREELMKCRSIRNIQYYSPIVETWTPEHYQEDIYHRKTDDFCLYVIAPEGRSFVSTLKSFLTACSERIDKPETIILCILPELDDVKMEGEQLHMVHRMIHTAYQRGIIILSNMEQVASYLYNLSQKCITSQKKPKTFFKKY